MYILPCSIWKFMWEKVDVLLLSRRREKVISYFIKYVDEMDALSFAWDTTQWCFQYLFLGMSNNNHPHTGCSLLASSRRWYKKEAGGWVRRGILVVTKKSLLLLRKLQCTVGLYWVCILQKRFLKILIPKIKFLKEYSLCDKLYNDIFLTNQIFTYWTLSYHSYG